MINDCPAPNLSIVPTVKSTKMCVKSIGPAMNGKQSPVSAMINYLFARFISGTAATKPIRSNHRYTQMHADQGRTGALDRVMSVAEFDHLRLYSEVLHLCASV